MKIDATDISTCQCVSVCEREREFVREIVCASVSERVIEGESVCVRERVCV